jgi:hypothetical protein
MGKIIFASLLFIGLVFAQSGANKTLYAPGEIIIKYEKSGPQTRGKDILNEHQNIFEKLKLRLSGVNIVSCTPVFKGVVNEMIKENQTEEQLFKSKSANKKLNLTSVTLNKTSFSNILLLKIDKPNTDIAALVDSINKNLDVLASEGIKIDYAEPNYIKKVAADSNDPLYSQQWSH